MNNLFIQFDYEICFNKYDESIHFSMSNVSEDNRLLQIDKSFQGSYEYLIINIFSSVNRNARRGVDEFPVIAYVTDS